MTKPLLTDADYQRAAQRLGCATAAIKAFAQVESPSGPFDADGAPSILFERHVFRRLTGGKFYKLVPDLSSSTPGGYGLHSAQHGRLRRAVALDRDAALQAASWGQFQIMGFNYKRAGFGSLQAFVNAMYRSAADHLAAFVSFIESDPNLKRAIINHDWPTAALLYNGPGYRANAYDVKMAAAFSAFAKSAGVA